MVRGLSIDCEIIDEDIDDDKEASSRRVLQFANEAALVLIFFFY